MNRLIAANILTTLAANGLTMTEEQCQKYTNVLASSTIIAGNLTEMSDTALRIATDHGFTEATPAEDIALMHSELSEALEDIRKGRPLNEMHYESPSVQGGPHKPCGVPSEMADEIIRVLHFCGKHGIDIEAAVVEKMAYNDSRPFRHGGKVL